MEEIRNESVITDEYLENETFEKPDMSEEVVAEEVIRDEESAAPEVVPEPEPEPEPEAVPDNAPAEPSEPESEPDKKTEPEDVPAEEPSEPEEKQKYSDARPFRNRGGIIRIEGGMPERQMSEKKKAAAMIMDARDQKKPITVTISGIEPIRNSDGEYIMTPVAFLDGWKIYVLKDHFIDRFSYNFNTESEAETLDRRIRLSIGSEVDVVPLQIITDDGRSLVVASRILGMKYKRDRMWFRENRKSDGTSEYVIMEGKLVEARIVGVTRHAVFVEVFGVEAPIRDRDVSYSRLADCREKFQTGEKVRVRVTRIQRDFDTGDVDFEGSIKDAYNDPRAEEFMKYVQGGEYSGVVQMIETDPNKGQAAAYVRLDGSELEIRCSYPRGANRTMPQIGDSVRVAVARKNPNNYRLWGTIKWVNSRD